MASVTVAGRSTVSLPAVAEAGSDDGVVGELPSQEPAPASGTARRRSRRWPKRLMP
jgi:hypothetical protein